MVASHFIIPVITDYSISPSTLYPISESFQSFKSIYAFLFLPVIPYTDYRAACHRLQRHSDGLCCQAPYRFWEQARY